MNSSLLLFFLMSLFFLLYFVGRKKSLQLVQGNIRKLHSLPHHYGWLAGIKGFIPGFIVFILWAMFQNSILDHLTLSMLSGEVGSETANFTDFERFTLLKDIQNSTEDSGLPSALLDAIQEKYTFDLTPFSNYYASIHSWVTWGFFLSAVILSSMAGFFTLRNITADEKSREWLEELIQVSLLVAASIATLTTIGIVSSLLFETIQFFNHTTVLDFVFGLKWSPQTSIRVDQIGSSGSFGAVPLFMGTMLITFIAMTIAAPIGLLSAVYTTEFASQGTRKIVKPLIEILAGIPTVVYGFLAALLVAPFIRNAGEMIGVEIASESALAAGIVMGVMIIPLISSLTDDAIKAVPQSLRDASLGLGATKTETILKVIVPAALPGIVSSLLLATSRAIGETMIVVMAAGMAAKLTVNPLEAVTTVTVQIVALLTGDQEFASAKTLSAFALGLALFLTTLILNSLALYVTRKYREEYD